MTEFWTGDNWEEGWYDVKGYFHVYRPDYPNCNDSGYAFRYHIVWWLNTGDVIKHPYVIHHVDEIRENDCIENLEKKLSGEHTRDHQALEDVQLVCNHCMIEYTLPQWRLNDGTRGKYCSLECYHRSYPVQTIIVEEGRSWLTCKCNYCEALFPVRVSRFKQNNGAKFCRRECYFNHKRMVGVA